MNLCVVSTYNGTKEDYLKLYESFKDDIAKYTDGFEMGFVRDGKVIIVANVTDEEKFYALFEENENLRQEYGLNVLAYGHPKDNNEEIYTVIEVESMDKMQEMLKLPEMIKLRTEAGVDLDTQKFILLEGGN